MADVYPRQQQHLVNVNKWGLKVVTAVCEDVDEYKPEGSDFLHAMHITFEENLETAPGARPEA